MNITEPGVLFLTEEGVTFTDFTFELEPDEQKFSEEDIEHLGKIIALKWAVEKILAELHRQTGNFVSTPLSKDFH